MKSNNTSSSITTSNNTSNKSNITSNKQQITNTIRSTTTTNDETIINKHIKTNLNIDIPLKSILNSTDISSDNIKNNSNTKKSLTKNTYNYGIPRLQSTRLYTSNKNINTNNHKK